MSKRINAKINTCKVWRTLNISVFTFSIEDFFIHIFSRNFFLFKFSVEDFLFTFSVEEFFYSLFQQRIFYSIFQQRIFSIQNDFCNCLHPLKCHFFSYNDYLNLPVSPDKINVQNSGPGQNNGTTLVNGSFFYLIRSWIIFDINHSFNTSRN